MNIRHNFEFGYLDLMDSYAVITCNQGVNIDTAEVNLVQSVLDTAFNGEKFGMIANRENDYSVNPIAIRDLFSREDLVAGAIVGGSKMVEINARLEGQIITGAPIAHFTNMDSAVKRIKEAVSKGLR